MKIVMFAAAVLALTGCGTDSKTRLASKDQVRLSPHAEPVCLLRSPLPSDIRYTVIGEVKADKGFYGSSNELLPVIADEARKVGADAIINMKTGQKIGLIAWAHPVGNGTAIKLANRSDLECIKQGGEIR